MDDPRWAIDLPPMVDDIGVAVIEHGERGHDLDPEHPEACLCGKVEPYYFCDGPGVESLTLQARLTARTEGDR